MRGGANLALTPVVLIKGGEKQSAFFFLSLWTNLHYAESILSS
jgi:hypothetical protein